MVRQNVSGIILQLVSVFLLFDGNPQNLSDPTFRAYGCHTSILVRTGPGGSFPVACTVWPDASAGRESEFYVETAHPRPGQILMGCAFGFDRSKNRSDCVAPDFAQPSYKSPDDGYRGPGSTAEVEVVSEVEGERGVGALGDVDRPEARRPGGGRRQPKRR